MPSISLRWRQQQQRVLTHGTQSQGNSEAAERPAGDAQSPPNNAPQSLTLRLPLSPISASDNALQPLALQLPLSSVSSPECKAIPVMLPSINSSAIETNGSAYSLP